ncbi:hypothetical protein, partial [Bacillus pumilus]|uniref:hypothetical protein n=1 Tax=Bacillus pumilus TaxID=1408 RepID=UPI0034D96ADD
KKHHIISSSITITHISPFNTSIKTFLHFLIPFFLSSKKSNPLLINPILHF